MDKIRTANLRKNSIREYDIDILKGLGIILVVIGHLEPDKILLRHIYSFHMFLFFFVSGYLCKIVRENYLNYIIKRTKRLLLPFAFWNITAIGIEEILFGTLNWVSCIEQLFFLRGASCIIQV